MTNSYMTSNRILIDTNIVVSLLNTRDSSHASVLQNLKNFEEDHTTFFLNTIILSEICTVVLLRSKSVSLAQKARELLISPNGNYVVAAFDTQLEQATYRIFTEQTKPQLSVADCSLIAQAKLHNTENIFTLDVQLQKALKKYGLRSVL